MSGDERFGRARERGVGSPDPSSVEGSEGVQQGRRPREQAGVVLGMPQGPADVVTARSRMHAHDHVKGAGAGAALARVETGGEWPPGVGGFDGHVVSSLLGVPVVAGAVEKGRSCSRTRFLSAGVCPNRIIHTDDRRKIRLNGLCNST